MSMRSPHPTALTGVPLGEPLSTRYLYRLQCLTDLNQLCLLTVILGVWLTTGSDRYQCGGSRCPSFPSPGRCPMFRGLRRACGPNPAPLRWPSSTQRRYVNRSTSLTSTGLMIRNSWRRPSKKSAINTDARDTCGLID